MATTTLPNKPVMTAQRVVGLMTHRHSVSCDINGDNILYSILQEGMIERHVKALTELVNNSKQGFVSLTTSKGTSLVINYHLCMLVGCVNYL